MIGKGIALALAATGGVAAAAIPAVTPAAMTEQSVDGTVIPASALTFTGVNVDALIAAPVLDAAQRQVGSVAELFIDGNGAISGAVVSVGGLFSQREVALEMADMQVMSMPDGAFVVQASMTAEGLDALPVFES
ncbi:PRC-barrel domain-containing protein [Pseudoroseicyclus sp. CXY001]|uniref:PRC-barrel domain-containing protein n=1 Tax=Pseudoroseicyclus sp. CXY001 TaxID=3242492 RepID=UPI00358DB7AB